MGSLGDHARVVPAAGRTCSGRWGTGPAVVRHRRAGPQPRGRRRGADLSEWFGWETTPDDILAACLLAIAVIAIVWMIVKERPPRVGTPLVKPLAA
ncbi:MAG: hypothetical protein M5U09_22125 [Gammaproteobacteria bacterium]|nr:hypothetical protein [Gammaproteobacteria bacterium]